MPRVFADTSIPSTERRNGTPANAAKRFWTQRGAQDVEAVIQDLLAAPYRAVLIGVLAKTQSSNICDGSIEVSSTFRS
ncbi:hypothetical protein M407DRAFT_32382 [Tulasnella calospora MUT 4182]|uniref:Uncharacterized protein n=1 Tax=Tulasnella calospora MUT 4182 TaxID=1051891 RepID=A0A0C3Q4U9_9AGAM|nr:hypothetical protein M407DRAFT_32382 [Tulasnella calospora MUT 4182]